MNINFSFLSLLLTVTPSVTQNLTSLLPPSESFIFMFSYNFLTERKQSKNPDDIFLNFEEFVIETNEKQKA